MTEATRRAEKALAVNDLLAAAYEPDEHPGRMPAVDELVCTILSQNTTDASRDKAFAQLSSAYDSWEEVRDAPTDDVEDLIRVCGLANQKAPRIQGAIKAIGEHTGGEISLAFLREMTPDEARAWLTAIPGVGVKTASIVLLFALDIPALPVDTHVHRVSGRIGLIPPKMSAEKAHYALEALVPEDEYLPFHVRVIQHGRTVCKARRPLCDNCPVTELCDWFAETSAEGSA